MWRGSGRPNTTEGLRKSRADRVNAKLIFIPDEDNNGIPYRENVEWLEQWIPDLRERRLRSDRRIYLVVCVNEDYPTQIWSMKNNYYKGTCYLEWERKEDE